MAIPSKRALLRLVKFSARIEVHLQKIASKPGDREIPHWKHEGRGWLRQMEEALTHVGKKTSAAWQSRIASYWTALQDRDKMAQS
jgi:hypothetical protein